MISMIERCSVRPDWSRVLLALLVAVVVPVLAFAQPAGSMLEPRADVDTLTSPAMRGRGYLHGGHLRAAQFIRDRFAALGLKPLGDNYMQAFPIRVNEFPAEPRLVIDGNQALLGRDFLPADMCGSGAIDLGRIVEVGGGVVVPRTDINEYKGLDPDGAVVVIDEAVAEKYTKDASIDRDFLSVALRTEVAQIFGARAVILLGNDITPGKGDTALGIPVLRMLRSAYKAGSRRATIAAGSRVISTTSNNVVAMLPGTGTTDSAVVLTAHYDHLGGIGDSVYFPGANDNASGTAMLLSLARNLKEHPLRYPVVFIAFSGEESGLIGSRYFSEHALVNLPGVRFLVNMDMTASGKEGVMAVGGVEFAAEFALLSQAASEVGVADIRKRENAPNSDHFFLVREGARGFYIYPFTGLQPYHNIADRVATLEWDVFERYRAMMLGFLRKL